MFEHDGLMLAIRPTQLNSILMHEMTLTQGSSVIPLYSTWCVCFFLFCSFFHVSTLTTNMKFRFPFYSVSHMFCSMTVHNQLVNASIHSYLAMSIQSKFIIYLFQLANFNGRLQFLAPFFLQSISSFWFCLCLYLSLSQRATSYIVIAWTIILLGYVSFVHSFVSFCWLVDFVS